MLNILPATPANVPAIVDLIAQLAEYEKLSHQVTGTPDMLHEALFGSRPAAECVVAFETQNGSQKVIGFALYFTTYSTFLAKPGLYLEDLFVIPTARGRGYGKALIVHLAALAHARHYGRFEWRVLDWNTPSIEFYKSLGAQILPEWHLVRMTSDEMAALIEK